MPGCCKNYRSKLILLLNTVNSSTTLGLTGLLHYHFMKLDQQSVKQTKKFPAQISTVCHKTEGNNESHLSKEIIAFVGQNTFNHTKIYVYRKKAAQNYVAGSLGYWVVKFNLKKIEKLTVAHE